ncbi:acyltransferase family protein [Paraburkholderia tropica]|uniref:acyltransferase family protein n=1 Tax=Paraburkholderia tropica TaxID=92647 RepID=UPI002AAF59EE|nr:acyltransferase [Paraburkholderia tropica]
MKNHKIETTEGQWSVLAGLRFFLAAVVVCGHFVLMVRPDNHHVFGDGYLNPLSAVYGFFILSGYSIAASLDRENSGFYRRRFIRIWPLYLAVIAFGLAAYLLSPTGFTWPVEDQHVPTASGLQIIASLLMLQTIISSPIPTIGPIWSLAGEWWHYMVAPLLKRFSNGVLLGWMAISFAFFISLHDAGPGVACMDRFTLGKAVLGLSWVWVTGFVYYRMRGTAVGFAVLVAPSLFALTIGHSPGVPMFITAFALILCEGRNLGERTIAALNFLGDWSYPLYLFHIPAFLIALTLGSNRSIITLGAAFGTSLAALYMVDYPSRKLFKRRKSNAAVAASVESA